MKRCSRCWMPNTRPNSTFTDGVCPACHHYDHRKDINWSARWQELEYLSDQYRRSKGYDCVVPVSGGKDSYTLVKIAVENLEMHPLLVTVTDSFTHTAAGIHNLRNLITRYGLNHYQYTIAHNLFIKATRSAFERTGEALKYVEAAIYTIPYMVASAFQIPLVIFGENGSYEYGSGSDMEDATPYILDIADGLRKQSSWWAEGGITRKDLQDLTSFQIAFCKPKMIFMSHFKPWSSVEHLEIAKARGFKDLDDTGEWQRQGTIEQFEQIDSVAYMVHLWLKYPKFGFQRAMDIASRRLREGLMDLDDVKKVAQCVDPNLDPWALEDFCHTLGYTKQKFWAITEKYWNPDIFEKRGGKWLPK